LRGHLPKLFYFAQNKLHPHQLMSNFEQVSQRARQCFSSFAMRCKPVFRLTQQPAEKDEPGRLEGIATKNFYDSLHVGRTRCAATRSAGL
jgi:hypothetical protein